MRIAFLALSAMAMGACSEPEFDQAHALYGARALQCAGVTRNAEESCIGRSVVLTGFTIDNAPYGYRMSVENPMNGNDKGSEDDFEVSYGETFTRGLQGKVQVKGIIASRGTFTSKPYVLITEATPATLTSQEFALKVEREKTPYLSPEQKIAEARKEGSKALEQWDAAIRQNNDEMQSTLAARAIAHQVRLSGDVRVDMYGMPDGRWIGCKTVIYPQGAPITTCDGEP